MEGEGRVEPVAVPTRHDLSRSLARETKLREQLEHARKMESIGTLAGGIAHDLTAC